MEDLLVAKGLFTIYQGKHGSQNVVALKGINLELKRGEFVSVVGTSGAGKSTLLRVLGGLQYPSAGTVNYEGLEITKLSEDDLVPFRRKTVGFVFQEGNLLPSYSAFDNVVKTLRYSGNSIRDSRKRATEVLTELGLKSRMHDLPHRLSGGERQRVAIARALANKPKVVLADEPTGSLDLENTDQVMGIFKDLFKEQETSFFIVTHSQHVASYSDRSLELEDGKFIGQHAGDSDIYNLNESRELIINDDGSLYLPPEMLGLVVQYGNLWDMELDLSNGIPRILLRPRLSTEEHDNCPVCKAPLTKSKYHCTSCGAKLF